MKIDNEESYNSILNTESDESSEDYEHHTDELGELDQIILDAEEYPDMDNHHSQSGIPNNLAILDNAQLRIIAEIGEVALTINELLELKAGSILNIGKVNQFVRLKVNDSYFAKGILVDIDGRLGVKLISKSAV